MRQSSCIRRSVARGQCPLLVAARGEVVGGGVGSAGLSRPPRRTPQWAPGSARVPPPQHKVAARERHRLPSSPAKNVVTSFPRGAPAVADATDSGLRRAEQQRAATVARETQSEDGTTLSLVDVNPEPRWPGAVLVAVEEPAIAGGAVSVIPAAAGLNPMGLFLIDVHPDQMWPRAVLVTVTEPTNAMGAVSMIPPAAGFAPLCGTFGVPPNATAHLRAEPDRSDPAAVKPATGRASTTAACAAMEPTFALAVPVTPGAGPASTAGRFVRCFDTCCDDSLGGGCEEAHSRRFCVKLHKRPLLVRFFPTADRRASN